jgi:hypothetical protein
MESLKKFEEIYQKDKPQDFFTVLDPKHPGNFRPLTLEDFYRAAEGIQLHDGVPDEVRSHFQTARNLLIYSWFYYPFNVTAQFCAYTSVEFALRIKDDNHPGRPSFRRLLRKAVEQKWISDDGFSHIRRRREAFREYNQELLTEFQLPEKELVDDYCKTLAEALPYLRNDLAHGISFLHHSGAKDVQICADLINQLFPKPNVHKRK